MKDTKNVNEIIIKAVDCMGVAATIIDTEGEIVYYNKQAEMTLDRKPEYVGNKVFDYHKKESSNNRINEMLQAFKQGRTEPFHYDAKPYGNPIAVTVAPILDDGIFVGCVQTVIQKS